MLQGLHLRSGVNVRMTRELKSRRLYQITNHEQWSTKFVRSDGQRIPSGVRCLSKRIAIVCITNERSICNGTRACFSCVVWCDVFAESPCEEVGFSSYLWSSRRCAWSPAFPLRGLLQMWHTSLVEAACVGSLRRSRASFRSVIHISSQASYELENEESRDEVEWLEEKKARKATANEIFVASVIKRAGNH